MATSGSYNTNKYTTSSSGTIGLNLSWSVKSQSIENNTTTITWTLKSNGTMSSGYYVKAGPVTCTINGSKVVNTTSRFDMKGSGGYKKTGTLTIAHGADGSKSFSVSVQAAIYSTSVNCTVSKSGIALPKILRYAQINSFSDFTNNLTRDGYPTLVYSNPAGTSLTTGLKCRLCWDNSGTTNYSDWVTLNDEGGEYTFTSSTLKATNITSMLNACPTSNTLAVTCELASTLNGVEDSVTKVVSMNVVDSNPLAGTASYHDTNSSVIPKTGSSSIIVQSQSTLRIQMTTPTAQNGASLDGCYLIINNTLYEMNVGSGIYYYDFVQPSLSGTFPTSIDVTDTRGNVTTVSFDVVVQAWGAPTALFTLARVNGFYTDTVLYVDGSISSVSGTNTMTIKEHHRQSGTTTWSTDTTVQNKTNTTISLDNSYVWEVQVLVSDEYATTTYDAVVGKGIPIMFIDKNMNSVGINGYPTEDDQLYVNGTVKSTGMVTCGDLNPTVESTNVLSECITNDFSSFTVNSVNFDRAGRLCQLRISGTRTNTCGSGGNLMTGNLGSVAIKYKPSYTVTGASYYGGRCIGFSINSEGKCIVRNASSSTMAANSGFEVSITWLYTGTLPSVTS